MGLALHKQQAGESCETLVIGLGVTGLSIARYLYDHEIPFVMADTRTLPPQLDIFRQKFPNTKTCLGELSTNLFKGVRQILVSPGIDINNQHIQAAVKRGAECYGDVELFVNNTQIPIVAITGSNGKSTVTSLVAAMAKSANVKAYAGGNLGLPAMELLGFRDAELFVLELSSFQLESTRSLKPRVSAVLNISPDHLDRHGSVDRYARIKAKIYAHATASVVNRDDEFVKKMKTSGVVFSFGLGYSTDNGFGVIRNGSNTFLAKGKHCLLATDELALQGEAGVLNSLAALATGEALGLPLEKMLATLKCFKGLPHRLSLVGKANGVSWFNDSKGTNVGASVSSLRSLQANIILLAGGVFKGGDLHLFHDAVARHARHVILFGQDANLLKQALHDVPSIHIATSIRDAVGVAQDLSKPGDKVLLSPACASFDMYENYTARGEDFESCVREMAL